MEYPAEFQGAAPETLARLAVSKIMTLTSTYDHRIIQGAQSGDFLRVVHQLLLGEDGFYDEIFARCASPTSRSAGCRTSPPSHDDDVNKTARVQELIHAYRVRGHLMADTDPLEYRQRRHPDLDVATHGLTLWDLDREFATGGFGGKPIAKLRDILGVLRDSYCRTVGIEYMHIQDPEQRELDPGRASSAPTPSPTARSSCASCAGSTPPRRSRRSCRPSSSARSGSPSRAASRSSRCSTRVLESAAAGRPRRGRASACRTAAGSTCSPTSSASPTARSSASSRATSDPSRVAGLRRREVPPRHRGHLHRERRRARSTVYLAANPSPPRGGRPGARGHRPRQAGPARPRRASFTVLPVLMHGDAAFAGQGVVAETLNLSPAARLPHRRHRPRRRQQPGRLHHLARGAAGRRSTPPTSPG